MSERVHRVLDGDLSRARLTPGERGRLAAYDEAVDRALAPLRAETAPDLTADVMRRVAALPAYGAAPAAAPNGLLARLWAPRPVTVRVRPVFALAAAVAVLVLSFVTGPDPAVTPASAGPAVASVDGDAAPAADGPVLVQFRLEAPEAREVRLAADFTGWQPTHALHRSETGLWTVVVAVAPGVHQYGFVVDGERWTPDPLAPQVDDGFGGSNSRLDVVSLAGAAL